jgi:hypothetical protein
VEVTTSSFKNKNLENECHVSAANLFNLKKEAKN